MTTGMTTGITTNEALILPQIFSHGAEQPEALFALLEDRIRRYTMGDSTSVPVDTARRLLEGILYCLDLHRRNPTRDVPQSAPVEARRQAGVGAARRAAKRAKLLRLQAQRTPPPLVNTAYCDTMDALPAFFAGYDADFFAQEIPCSFDYPLCHPASETLLGAEYMQDFLRRLLAENTLLRAFPRDSLLALYETYYIDYTDLLVNLYLPAAEAATLCTLAGEDARTLSLSAAGMARAGQMLAQAEEAQAREMICIAAARTLANCGLSGDFLCAYLQQTALDLLIRLRAAAGASNTAQQGRDEEKRSD